MECCPHCLLQVQMRKKASTGVEVGICPVHGEILKVLLVRR